MRNSLLVASLLSLTVAMAPACATKKFVRTEVGAVNSKVDTLSGTVEQTQARIQTDEQKIGQVDSKAEAAGKSAEAAQNTANQAQAAARQVDTKVDKVSADLTATNANVAAGRKLMYEVTLSEDQGNFKFGKTALPDEAKAKIDQVVSDLKGQQGKDIYIEIEGHTDNVGAKETNYELGMKRAEEVKQYLYMQHQIPLHKINVISYGEDKPVAPNNTRAGRAQNRRVVIRVLS
jgi:peptidoglycan-associated lipoprotein